MVGLLPSRSLKRAENALVVSFWSTSKAVVSTRPWAVSRPSEATSVEKISRPASFWPAATMPNSDACLIELMVSPPALARPITFAPEACARSRNEDHSLVPSGCRTAPHNLDRKSIEYGKGVQSRVELGCVHIHKNKHTK